ncbi:MAG TPA: lipoate--protein ligase family protein [Pirellulales bacterium]|jgi:lipoate-protein ligase A|nr:lipoate--protein ligase family protein [Pirellulales bacterium]
MFLLDLSLPSPEANLALDEALLEQAEAGGRPWECLRLWEPAGAIVVIGRSSQLEQEASEAACREWGAAILRRVSGGAAIVAAPGCLMYGVVLSLELRPQLRAIDEAHRFVLGKLVEAIRPLAPQVERRGTSDLALGERKFSGNSLRIKREHLLYHGTLLYDFPLELIGACLRQPPRQPEYRAGRSHLDFVVNLPVDATSLRRALIAAWEAEEPLVDWPRELTERLVAERYSQREWNYRR